MKGVLIKIKTGILLLFIVNFLNSCSPYTLVVGAFSVGYLSNDNVPYSINKMDREIYRDARKVLQNNTANKYNNVKIIVSNGVVYLVGSINNVSIVNRITNKISAIKNVSNVVTDGLFVERDDKKNINYFVTLKIKSKLLIVPNVKSFNYSVYTYDNTVYVTGFAHSYNELSRISNMIAKTRGVKKVINYAIVANKEE
jgi:osmotically-inducible protein OsmY